MSRFTAGEKTDAYRTSRTLLRTCTHDENRYERNRNENENSSYFFFFLPPPPPPNGERKIPSRNSLRVRNNTTPSCTRRPNRGNREQKRTTNRGFLFTTVRGYLRVLYAFCGCLRSRRVRKPTLINGLSADSKLIEFAFAAGPRLERRCVSDAVPRR